MFPYLNGNGFSLRCCPIWDLVCLKRAGDWQFIFHVDRDDGVIFTSSWQRSARSSCHNFSECKCNNTLFFLFSKHEWLCFVVNSTNSPVTKVMKWDIFSFSAGGVSDAALHVRWWRREEDGWQLPPSSALDEPNRPFILPAQTSLGRWSSAQGPCWAGQAITGPWNVSPGCNTWRSLTFFTYFSFFRNVCALYGFTASRFLFC